MADISKGGFKLKHIDRKALKGGAGDAPAAGGEKKAVKSVAAPKEVSGEQEIKLDGNKWIVRNVKDKKDVEIKITEPKQAVLISRVQGSVITVKGKCTAISVADASASGILFDDIVASVEVVNSSKLQLQANGVIPQIALDKSSSITVYLQTAVGLAVSIATSQATDVNVVVPGAKEEDDPVEHPIPYQYVSEFKGDKLVTTTSHHV